MSLTGPYDLLSPQDQALAAAMASQGAPTPAAPSVYEFMPEAQIKAQRKAGDDLLAQAMSTAPIGGAGWAKGLGVLNRGLQGALGGMQQRAAVDAEKANEKARSDILTGAMGGGAIDWTALARDPSMRGVAVQGMMTDRQRKEQEARDERRFAAQDSRLDRQQSFAEQQAELNRQHQAQLRADQNAARQESIKLQRDLANQGRITYRPLSPDEQKQYPGATQVGSDGKLVYAPAEAIKQSATHPGDLTAEDRAATASALGVPANVVDPFAGIKDPKARKTAQDEESKYIRKMREGFDKERQALNARVDVLNRFDAALKASGGTSGLLGTIPGGVAVGGVFNKAIRDMSVLQDEIAPKMRESGSGATSDTDLRGFKNAAPGPDKPTEVNQNISNAWRAQTQREMDRVEFMEAFATAHGHTRGAETAWKQYINANPILDPAGVEKNQIRMNPNRASWQDWFRAQNQRARMGQGQPADQSSYAPPPTFRAGPASGAKPDYKSRYGLE